MVRILTGSILLTVGGSTYLAGHWSTITQDHHSMRAPDNGQGS
uniref:Secreted protein n=1 Tax=Ascaris lumbricoides TaxID=6252 RepID=A0A0M3HKK2_ASCLU